MAGPTPAIMLLNTTTRKEQSTGNSFVSNRFTAANRPPRIAQILLDHLPQSVFALSFALVLVFLLVIPEGDLLLSLPLPLPLSLSLPLLLPLSVVCCLFLVCLFLLSS
jgi:hypothetical protein